MLLIFKDQLCASKNCSAFVKKHVAVLNHFSRGYGFSIRSFDGLVLFYFASKTMAYF